MNNHACHRLGRPGNNRHADITEMTFFAMVMKMMGRFRIAGDLLLVMRSMNHFSRRQKDKRKKKKKRNGRSNSGRHV